jgi:hypothetical protein
VIEIKAAAVAATIFILSICPSLSWAPALLDAGQMVACGSATQCDNTPTAKVSRLSYCKAMKLRLLQQNASIVG